MGFLVLMLKILSQDYYWDYLFPRCWLEFMLLENQCQEDNFRFLKLKNLLFTVEIKGRELRKIILRTYDNKDELKNEINKSLLN